LLHPVGDLFELYDDSGTYKPKIYICVCVFWKVTLLLTSISQNCLRFNRSAGMNTVHSLLEKYEYLLKPFFSIYLTVFLFLLNYFWW